jgi:ubiquinone/menaquinone biosynthesis C-methylase UbiE
MLLQTLRTWWTKVQLVGSQGRSGKDWFYDRTLRFPEYAQDNLRTLPRLEPYDGLASIWHEFASRFQYNYPAFIMHMAKIDRLESWSALDLACGTGNIASRLSLCASEVIGLDASEAMLEQARLRSSNSRAVQYVLGDFRDYRLDRTFDFAVCGCNSLNYVKNVGDLHTVFARTAEHLRPGGRFVFDTLTETAMQIASGMYLHIQIGKNRFVMRFKYDQASRTQMTQVLMASGIETHVQTPIDAKEVVAAARHSGLALVDCFSSPFGSGRRLTGLVCFFVMRRER